MTNALPVHRLDLDVGAAAQAPAAYVRAINSDVVRLEQDYTRQGERDQHYNYVAPEFDFCCDLVYDDAGLVLAYPGIAVRVL